MADQGSSSSHTASAPDLEILGDQVTLHPSGYVEPAQRKDDGKEQALMQHMARFRNSPLEVCIRFIITILQAMATNQDTGRL